MSEKPIFLMKQIKCNIKTFKKRYKKILREGIKLPQDEWLRDNYYLLIREAESALKDIKSAKGITVFEGESVMYALVSRAAKDISENYLENLKQELKLSAEDISTADFELCQIFFAAFFLNECAKSYEEQNAGLMEKGVKGLRLIPSLYFDELIDEFSAVEKLFLADPAGVYPKMAKDSKVFYRKQCSELARMMKITEKDVAQGVLTKATEAENPRERHIGYYIIEDNIKRKKRKIKARLYVILRGGIPAAAAVIAALFLKRPLLALPLYLPLFEIIRPIIEDLIMRNVDPYLLPKMDKKTQEVKNSNSLILVSSMVPKPEKLPALSEHLVSLIERNSEPNIKLCFLADLKESEIKSRPEDEMMIRALKKEFERLNTEYDDKFILAVRRRVKINTQNSYAGWERKRGAILSLACYCSGEDVEFEELYDPSDFLHRTDFFIALDSDTELLMGTVNEMVSAAVHPLNIPQIGINGRVTRGYGIIAPKIGTDIKSAGKTAFSRLMTGTGGITVYDFACKNIYQDIFCEGIFSGKGLINVKTFYKVIKYAFPDETVLSHDILEGGFMRCGFMSDVEMTDGCPSEFFSWAKRLHRWVRGDFQNIPWIFSKIPVKVGKTENPLSYSARFYITDNVVRERAAASPLFLYISCLIRSEYAWLFVILAILSPMAANLYSGVKSLISGGRQTVVRKYYSNIATDTLHEFKKGVFSAVTGFYTSCIMTDAMIRALYRLFISKKNLLQWVTAAEAEKTAAKGLGASVYRQSICIFAAAVSFLFRNTAMSIYGAVMILSPFVCFAVSKRTAFRKTELSDEDKGRLISYAAELWGFYRDTVTESDNFLPPDNIQEAPVKAVAHRTSPTNIGLYMLSVIAAFDFGFIDREETAARIENTLSSIRKLKKYHGNLLNWYDTTTLRPLEPEYCSTVDSGNFLCCIHTLKNALIENGFPNRLVSALEEAEKAADLSVLFDKKRKLFHIGFDLSENKMSNSYYDLLMSEARATSYYAIATEAVDKEHWGRLGRTLAKQDNFTGCVSWTGTMFEYFMPQIFLPVYYDTLSYEALRFCIYCQKKRGSRLSKPWGCSESGYYSFDNQLNYQYKANGIQKLGLCRGIGNEYVVSPYSSFLTLSMSPLSSMQNLKRLENELPIKGKYGFYEAADYTSSRVGSRTEIIRSFMAHHVGMSLCAADNCINDGILQKRFMKKEMRKAAELLEEKIPAGAFVYEDIVKDKKDARPLRYNSKTTYSDMNVDRPNISVITNSRLCLFTADNGNGYISFDDILLTCKSTDIIRNPKGLFFAVDDGKKTLSLSFAPVYLQNGQHRCEFSEKYTAYYAENRELQAGIRESVLESRNAVRIKLVIKNKTGARKNCSASACFEPVLARFADIIAHRAFNALFVSAKYENNTALFTKRVRNGEKNISLACGFLSDGDREYELNREKVTDRFGGTAGIFGKNAEFTSPVNGVPDPCYAEKLYFTLEPRSQTVIDFLITADEDEERAMEIFRELKDNSTEKRNSYSSALFYGSSLESRIFSFVLPSIVYNVSDFKTRKAAADKNSSGAQALWKYGISGDYPIVVIDFENKNEAYLRAVIRILKRCRSNFIFFDLAVLISDAGDYFSKEAAKVKRIISEESADKLIGIKNGIFILDKNLLKEDVNTVLCSACCIVEESIFSENEKNAVSKLINIKQSNPAAVLSEEDDLKASNGIFRKSGFTVKTPPELPWCNILAKEDFGTMVSDSALGFTWYKNSRENRVTPWNNDTATDNRGELLVIKINGRFYDLISGARCTFGANTAEYVGTVLNISYKVTVRLLKDYPTKRISVNFSNMSLADAEFKVCCYCEPCLGTDRSRSGAIKFRKIKNGLSFENPFNTGIPVIAVLESDKTPSSVFTDKSGFFGGRWEESVSSEKNCCAAVVNDIKIPAEKSESISYFLSCSETPKTIKNLSEYKFKTENTISINSSDKYLNRMFNTWLPVQIKNDRFFARTGFYQSSGAFGFRDQLQDAEALILIDPLLCRKHILKCCERIFPQGDALHWWHEDSEALRGVRTKCSDDKLWLAHCIYEYVSKTGDTGILKEKAGFVSGEELSMGETEKYQLCRVDSANTDTVFGHAERVCGSVEFGEHSLPLIGSCDWNDGFSAVGAKGKGESVWLAMFLSGIYEKMAYLSEIMKQEEKATSYRIKAAKLRKNIEEYCWDGEWYIRAFHDDGGKIGSRESSECKIDVIVQAFSVLLGENSSKRINTALDSVFKYLYDEENRIIRLFAPPFNDTKRIGYIGAYPAGVRENGGQYTHAAVWFAISLFTVGRANEGYNMIKCLNPAQRADDEELFARFKTEPYSMPADIYFNESCKGRGGWSHYTGAAGWYYRLIIEYMYGIKRAGDKIFVNPVFPDGFIPGTVDMNISGTDIKITFEGSGKGNTEIFTDGVRMDFIPVDSKRHFVTVKFKNNME